VFRKAAEIVRNGLIGNVTQVEVGLPAGHHDFAGTEPALLKKLATLPDKIGSPALVAVSYTHLPRMRMTFLAPRTPTRSF